jgi:hypothetical protein
MSRETGATEEQPLLSAKFVKRRQPLLSRLQEQLVKGRARDVTSYSLAQPLAAHSFVQPRLIWTHFKPFFW